MIERIPISDIDVYTTSKTRDMPADISMPSVQTTSKTRNTPADISMSSVQTLSQALTFPYMVLNMFMICVLCWLDLALMIPIIACSLVPRTEQDALCTFTCSETNFFLYTFRNCDLD